MKKKISNTEDYTKSMEDCIESETSWPANSKHVTVRVYLLSLILALIFAITTIISFGLTV